MENKEIMKNENLKALARELTMFVNTVNPDLVRDLETIPDIELEEYGNRSGLLGYLAADYLGLRRKMRFLGREIVREDQPEEVSVANDTKEEETAPKEVSPLDESNFVKTTGTIEMDGRVWTVEELEALEKAYNEGKELRREKPPLGVSANTKAWSKEEEEMLKSTYAPKTEEGPVEELAEEKVEEPVEETLPEKEEEAVPAQEFPEAEPEAESLDTEPASEEVKPEMEEAASEDESLRIEAEMREEARRLAQERIERELKEEAERIEAENKMLEEEARKIHEEYERRQAQMEEQFRRAVQEREALKKKQEAIRNAEQESVKEGTEPVREKVSLKDVSPREGNSPLNKVEEVVERAKEEIQELEEKLQEEKAQRKEEIKEFMQGGYNQTHSGEEEIIRPKEEAPVSNTEHEDDVTIKEKGKHKKSIFPWR